ncbi:MAG TPA: hypothetical protein VFW50_11240 [Streptosporangiaceae bacterium]|nr:hypothetical protein [Streptosporangiaceae bacterium]
MAEEPGGAVQLKQVKGGRDELAGVVYLESLRLLLTTGTGQPYQLAQ